MGTVQNSVHLMLLYSHRVKSSQILHAKTQMSAIPAVGDRLSHIDRLPKFSTLEISMEGASA